MACGSCGQRRSVVDPATAQAVAQGLGRSIEYTVEGPDGTSKKFDTYLEAVIYKRQVNGVLTTHA